MEGEFLVCTPSSRLKSIEIEEDLDLKFFRLLSLFFFLFFFLPSFFFILLRCFLIFFFLFVFVRFVRYDFLLKKYTYFKSDSFLNGIQKHDNLNETNYITLGLIDNLMILKRNFFFRLITNNDRQNFHPSFNKYEQMGLIDNYLNRYTNVVERNYHSSTYSHREYFRIPKCRISKRKARNKFQLPPLQTRAIFIRRRELGRLDSL